MNDMRPLYDKKSGLSMMLIGSKRIITTFGVCGGFFALATWLSNRLPLFGLLLAVSQNNAIGLGIEGLA
ncbi:hypothetical protein [Rhizobium sp. NXC24]|uniref:hypothetical protein n=2 Tax=Rhizobium TaxID=379 RepID=UPI00131A51F6|nr:hypothetical protein [Rhizobium sp. NXC24]